MDDYVAVEAYDVLLGASYSAGGSNAEAANHAETTNGSASASWDLTSGVTGKGWTLRGIDWATWTPIEFDVSGTTDEEVRSKVIPYLNQFGGSYVTSIGCS